MNPLDVQAGGLAISNESQVPDTAAVPPTPQEMMAICKCAYAAIKKRAGQVARSLYKVPRKAKVIVFLLVAAAVAVQMIFRPIDFGNGGNNNNGNDDDVNNPLYDDASGIGGYAEMAGSVPTMAPHDPFTPTFEPTFQWPRPSSLPSASPSGLPSMSPSGLPSNYPSLGPSLSPTRPTNEPSTSPSTYRPSPFPSSLPNPSPSSLPTWSELTHDDGDDLMNARSLRTAPEFVNGDGDDAIGLRRLKLVAEAGSMAFTMALKMLVEKVLGPVIQKLTLGMSKEKEN